ncbi:mercuric transporter MerT family protein [Methylomicrobium album]|uniref:Mercuric transport protein MerT n=1 Tax=Methylomicrobium album BG8 TaxID=686340 RepID=H8GIY8_METAL|nr:mercuric transporter MerT family protein [Methylomicrobium album]EIC31495.1 MerT mercuric transport protein [Methylomicrobium album BG8]
MNPKQTLMAAVFAGIGASLCCVAPLLLLSLGIGGAWVATLTAFEPLRPIFLGLAALFIGLSFRKLHLISPACETGKPCAEEDVIRKQRFIFWGVTLPLIGLLAFPWIAPFFY